MPDATTATSQLAGSQAPARICFVQRFFFVVTLLTNNFQRLWSARPVAAPVLHGLLLNQSWLLTNRRVLHPRRGMAMGHSLNHAQRQSPLDGAHHEMTTISTWMWFLWSDKATARELHPCTGCVLWREVEGAAAGSLQVFRLVVHWMELGDVIRLWDSEATAPRIVRSWNLDLEDECGRGSRSSASEADRVQRFVD